MFIKCFSILIITSLAFFVNMNAQQNNQKVQKFQYKDLDSLSNLPNSLVRKVIPIKAEKLPGNTSYNVKTISFEKILTYAIKSGLISKSLSKKYGTGLKSSCVACNNSLSFCVVNIPNNCNCLPKANFGLLLNFKSLTNFYIFCNK